MELMFLMKWQKIMHTKAHRANQKNWHSTATEIVAPSYLNQYISLQCPPVMMRNLDNLLRHPEIPLAGVTVQKPEEQEPAEETTEEPEENNGNADLPGGLVDNRPNENSSANPAGALGGMMGGMDGGRDRANIDDPTNALRFHDLKCLLGTHEWSTEVCVDDVIPIFE